MDDIKEQKKLLNEARFKATVELLSNFPKETITTFCQYIDTKFGMDNGDRLTELLTGENMNEFYTQYQKLLASKKGKDAVSSYVKLYKLNLLPKLIITLLSQEKPPVNSFSEEILGYYTMQLIDKPKILIYDKKDGVSIKRAEILKWISSNVLSKLEIIPEDLLDDYNGMLVKIGCAPETQTSMMRNISQIVILERSKRREGNETVNFYLVHGPQTPESILGNAGLAATKEYIDNIKGASRTWLERKLFVLTYLDKSVSLSPEYLYNNSNSKVTQIKTNMSPACDKWPFGERLSA